jgi:hypothetical protein
MAAADSFASPRNDNKKGKGNSNSKGNGKNNDKSHRIDFMWEFS